MTKKLILTAVAVLFGLTAQARERTNFDKGWRFLLGDSAIMAKEDFDATRQGSTTRSTGIANI